MPRRKIEDENIRNIQKSGDMYHINIPIELMRKLRWREHQKVVVKKYGKGLRILDWKKGKNNG